MHRLTTRGVAALCLGLSLTACGSYNSQYIGPADGPRARLRLSTDGSIRLLPNTSCVNWNVPGIGVAAYKSSGIPLPLSTANNGASLGMPYAPPPASLVTSELYVRSDQPIVVLYYKYTGSTHKDKVTTMHYCGGAFTFTPQAGKDYLGMFTEVEGTDRCIRTIVKADDKLEPIKNDYIPSVCEK